MNVIGRLGARGFTLIELVVSLAILALITTMALPMGEVVIQRNKEQDLRKALRQIRDSIDTYKQFYDDGHVLKKVDASGYPPSLAILEEGVVDAKSPEEKKVYFLRRLPRDPFAPEDIPAAETWGLRSYQSSPKNPQKGDDVFDVYSQSEGSGLNGVPYQEW
jgi:general secretion pathway protein G